MSSTPSPANSAGHTTTAISTANTTPAASTSGNASANPASASSNQSRRPPRKSTLTQQQKNQKRQRATQDQLSLLEVEFNKNPTPTATVRERIAQEINMTERSVQIWFQNRRAKIKMLAKKSIETGEDCDAIPESYRQYLAMQAMESGKPMPRGFLGQPMGMGSGMFFGAEAHNPQKVVIHHFHCRSLSIGSWRRIGQNAMDLVIFYSLGEKPCLTYYINNDAAGYKIEFPFSYIKNISLENGQSDGANVRQPGLVVELHQPPNFFMDNAGSGGFNRCGDFTEDQQASRVLVHHLGGDPRVLSGELAKLTLLESFQSRHQPQNLFNDLNVAAMSAPVSPVPHRPASANAMAHMQMPMFPPSSAIDMNSLHPGMPKGHKRTRSRSVPAMTDFSFLQQATPSFHIHHPSTTIADPSIFAPVPQQAGHLGPASSLRINTGHSFAQQNFDLKQYPMSAATTNTPSDYASPGYMGNGEMDPVPSAGLQTPYGLPFLSPTPDGTHGGIAPSVSPLSALSHGDPVIANQSPPLANMQRSASADFLSMGHAGAVGGDDAGMMLNEMFSKPVDLPFRGGALDDANLDLGLHDEPPHEELDMNSLLQHSFVDPSSLSS